MLETQASIEVHLRLLECGDLSPLSLRGDLSPRSYGRVNEPTAATGRSLQKFSI